ncbi:hypothetical protein RF11_08364 [Thelohanellus kitauei]|uniref:Uncharacterized protein n=1 Tax=Thelohanellus kitauei TaxID=669202 RepID=A0A0C2J2L5_THEKT|nr:hypothetical protein RF11_08364 [Thelohanellus kitauei]
MFSNHNIQFKLRRSNGLFVIFSIKDLIITFDGYNRTYTWVMDTFETVFAELRVRRVLANFEQYGGKLTDKNGQLVGSQTDESSEDKEDDMETNGVNEILGKDETDEVNETQEIIETQGDKETEHVNETNEQNEIRTSDEINAVNDTNVDQHNEIKNETENNNEQNGEIRKPELNQTKDNGEPSEEIGKPELDEKQDNNEIINVIQ